MTSLRTRLGALLYDWPRFERNLRGNWTRIHNRNERITPHDAGARCEWQFTSELHIANVFPSASTRLMRRALDDWPIRFDDALRLGDAIDVTFVIGHRGAARLPHLLAILPTIA